ncbi:uncharacterized protein LOC130744085 [Lotus japonicus]|uniref:uncharacterized protein LOC130744085 n=1 Tax=Lotus japonicus TaxID=34305 RepID=UPI00258AA3EB|nr:uncharacterized protein LOC130744085 [Lotus japonicus]
MDNNKEGGSVHRPPILDSTNYDYWKARMIAFFRSIDSKTWKSIVKGWKHPMKRDKEGTSTTELKLEEEWTKEEDDKALSNSKALNAIFNGVDKNMFRLINTCTVAKDAWEILRLAHEGTTRVRVSRLQLLTTQLENLKMKEDETISEFHMRVRDMVNASFAMGEQMSEEKLVRKILRSLPKRFDMKVTTTEEAQDIGTIKVDELIGSLQTFEMSLNERSDKKNKSITFVSNTEDDDLSEKESDENLSEAITLLGRKFNKFMRRFERRPRPNVPEKRSNIGKNSGYAHRNKEEYKPNKSKGKLGKGMVATWSDSDSEEEDEPQVMGLTVKCNSETESSDGEVSEEKLVETYKLLFNNWKDACEKGKKLEGTVKDLEIEKQNLLIVNDNLQEEVTVLKSKIEGMIKSVRMLNKGTDVFDLILETGKVAKDMTGLGYADDSYPLVQKVRSSSWRCHHYGQHGHIRPYCYRLYGAPQNWKLIQKYTYANPKRREWKPKNNVTSLVAYTSLRVSSKEDWYFDSGCFRHDGAKGKIKGSGKIVSGGSPNLNNVLLVEGLTANLISISQLCDLDLNVSFNKAGCKVTDENEEVIMIGVRSKDNCYIWSPQNKALTSMCLMSKKDEVKLWHKKLGHLNPKSMKKVISKEAIRGLPRLKIEEDKVCGECQVGKQTQTSHKKLTHVATTRSLELLHMDLMGPMQKENLWWKKHVFVCVDDFSRFTWNGVVERKHRTLQESARMLLHGKKVPYHLWAEVINTACYIYNRVIVRSGTDSTSYELWKCKKPAVKYFHVFGSKCYILTDREQRRKLDPKSDERIFLGYSMNSKAYMVFNSRTKTMKESINVVVDDSGNNLEEDNADGDDNVPQTVDERTNVTNIRSDIESEEQNEHVSPKEVVPSIKIQKIHPKKNIIENLNEGVITRSIDIIENACFISKIEPKNIKEALTDEYWMNVSGFSEKSDENGTVTRNNARLVAQGYTQIEGIDFDETFAPVACLDSIRLLLGVACLLKFKLYQVDVNSAFLNDYLNEEVYVEQTKGFVDPTFPDHVYKLRKVMYGLQQAPRAWYERLTEFLTNKGYNKEGIDKTLFVKNDGENIMIAQIYVDDIVFGGMSDNEFGW